MHTSMLLLSLWHTRRNFVFVTVGAENAVRIARTPSFTTTAPTNRIATAPRY